MASPLWATKSIKELITHSHASEDGLRRTLTATNLTTLGVGAIIGAGIFVITGQAAAQYAGPAIVLSFIVSGFACMFAGLCYAEFASMIPVAGSAYTYTYATLGEFIAWIIGWDLILEYLFAASTVAVGWGGYVVSFLKDFGIIIPPSMSSAPIDHIAGQGWIVHEGAILNFPAMFIIAIMTVLLVIGIRESAKINNIIVIVKVAVVLLFIGFGIWHIVPSNYTPFIPENTGTFGHFGLSGILRGAGVIFFAYIGFDAVSTAAQEARNPQRDMPIGILGSLGVATVLYIMVGLVLTGIVSFTQLNVPDPIAVGVNAAGAGLFWLRPLIKIGAIAGLSSVILVMLMGQPRIFFSMASDGLLPKTFSRIHPKFRTPYITTIITGSVSMVVAGLFPIGILGELVSIGTLLAFLIVCVGILVLRRTRPDLERPFRTPFVPVVPILGAIAAFVQMLALPGDTWLRLIIWMAIGFGIFFFYSRKHSKLTAVQAPPVSQ
jgi:basic amino acid/polyamine antiporter, APA family